MFVEWKPRTVFYPPDTLFTAFVATVQKIITYALGEHNPGSAQDGRISNDSCQPVECCWMGVLTGSSQIDGILSYRQDPRWLTGSLTLCL